MSDENLLLTIFFRHDQSKNLDEIQAYLRESGFWKEFPPPGIEIVTWYVMMGIGHVVTISVPPARLTRSQHCDRETRLAGFPHRDLHHV